jgi:hypothetical protein
MRSLLLPVLDGATKRPVWSMKIWLVLGMQAAKQKKSVSVCRQHG